MNVPIVERGQIWRRKKDGKLVRIEAVRIWYTEYDVHWRGQDFKGRGAIWSFNFLKAYERAEEESS